MPIAIEKKSEPKATCAQNRALAPGVSIDLATPLETPQIQPKSSCACGGGCPRCEAEALNIQPKLSIGEPNDPYEQEADRVADQVMRMPEPTVQRQAILENEEEAEEPIQTKPLATSITPLVHRQVMNNEVDETSIQQKTTGEVTPGISTATVSVIKSMRGGGQPLSSSARSYFEPRFGTNFSNVRVHHDTRAAHAARSVNARAFTHGHDVVFGSGEYTPDTSSGKSLLAHELTHVIQQANGGRQQIYRRPNPNPPPDPYVPGRPAHNHAASAGRWARVQANAAAVCTSSMIPMQIVPGLPPIPVPGTERGRIECACANLSPSGVLALARNVEMSSYPLAKAHLDHYLNGAGANYLEHSNLDTLMKTDVGARGVVARAISAADRGHVFIQQSHYSDQDMRHAFGGIDRVDYQVNRAAGTVDVWFQDRYDFHPAGFGYANKGVGDSAPPGRITNCVHAAAVEAKLSGAADYWMFGHATLPLSLFSSSSGGSGGSDLH